LSNLAVIAAFAALLVVIWILQSPWFKGALGEIRVHRALRRLLDEHEYRLFNDLTLPVRDGTTQIDHVIVSRFGVFVIETKNMKGWIFGGADQAQWTQVVYRRKSKFQNPIRQNYKHLKAVQEILRIDAHKLHGIVAFLGSATPKSAMPLGVVWGAQSLADYVKSKRVAVLSDDELRAFAESLSSGGFRSNILTRHAHVRHVKTQAATRLRESESCPRCGATLVERTNRQSGARFLACPKFPACRGTRKLS
jgi:restriction system protein